jgi:uncharacterized protein (TIGR00369 family)
MAESASETDSIWHQPVTLEGLNAFSDETAVSHLGIEFTDVGPDFLQATMPVDARTQQPYGLLHGGASVLLAETLGSSAANLCLDAEAQMAVGVEVNANHIRPVREGVVTGTARPLHRGRTTHVWEIRIRDEAGRLVCVSRLTIAVRTRR